MVGRDGGFFRAQFGFPAGEPGGAFGGDLGGGGGVGALAAEGVSDGICQLGEDEAGVAEQGDLGLVLFVEVAGVVGGVDDGHALGQRRGGQRVAVEAGADAEDEVGLGVE